MIMQLFMINNIHSNCNVKVRGQGAESMNFFISPRGPIGQRTSRTSQLNAFCPVQKY